MKQLEIQDHSDILRLLELSGKWECGQLKYIWGKYEDVTRWEGACFCSRAERGEFLGAFKTWFAQMETNLGDD